MTYPHPALILLAITIKVPIRIIVPHPPIRNTRRRNVNTIDGLKDQNGEILRLLQLKCSATLKSILTLLFYRLRQKNSLLNTVGLLTLVQGHRTRHILKQDKNKHGYRKQKVCPYTPPVVAGVDLPFTTSNTKDIILEEDDIYDVDRPYSLLDTIFHKDCRHYVSNEAHQERDGVITFDQIISHVFGQRQQNIQIAENNITLFKVDQNKTVRSEFIRWETLFNNLSYANNKKISSETKLAFLAKHFSDDGRPLIVSSFAASMNNRLG